MLTRVFTTVAAIVRGAFARLMGTEQTGSVELQVGERAPDFALAGSDGRTHRLSEYAGRPVVVAWFPKAFTGG